MREVVLIYMKKAQFPLLCIKEIGHRDSPWGTLIGIHSVCSSFLTGVTVKGGCTSFPYSTFPEHQPSITVHWEMALLTWAMVSKACDNATSVYATLRQQVARTDGTIFLGNEYTICSFSYEPVTFETICRGRGSNTSIHYFTYLEFTIVRKTNCILLPTIVPLNSVKYKQPTIHRNVID